MEPKEKDKVRYVGVNRPNLKNLNGVVQRVSTYNKSSLVDFYDADGRLISTEWVGAGALEAREPENTAEVLLEAELKAVSEEFVQISARYTHLRNRKAQLQNALQALKGVYR
jgi:hypothetical protein